MKKLTLGNVETKLGNRLFLKISNHKHLRVSEISRSLDCLYQLSCLALKKDQMVTSSISISQFDNLHANFYEKFILNSK